MRELTDFLNHGILPFVGRSEEIEGILSFWSEAIQRGGLQAFLMEGPAGGGKSRLAEELPEEVLRRGGIALRLKLYPDTPASIPADLARQTGLTERRLRLSDGPRDLIPRLRRLVRLRPTLLIIEDLHLLEPDSFGQLSSLLRDLADEGLALLILSRPLPPEIRGVITPWLVRETPLTPLDRERITQIWGRLFSSPAPGGVIEVIHRVTKGNPLALRSGLRGVIDRGVISESAGSWGISIATDLFARELKHGIRSLLDGLASHLSASERAAAVLLSRLGEIFSHETALVVLPDEEGKNLVEQLIFKGVLRSGGPVTLSLNQRESSAPPLYFTHTLLQEYCAGERLADARPLFEAILNPLPHYSYRLFYALGEAFEGIELTREESEQAIVEIRDVINGATYHPGWRQLDVVHGLAEKIIERGIASRFWDEEGETFYRGMSMILWAIYHARGWRDPEYAVQARRLEEITRSPRSHRLARMRLRALAQMVDVYQTEKRARETIELDGEISRLFEAYPDLELDPQYFYYLGRIVHRAPHLYIACRKVIERYTELQHRTAEMSPDARIRLKRIGPHLLPIFRTSQEFAERLALLNRLEADPDIPDYLLFVYREQTLLSGGEFERLARVIGSSKETAASFDDTLGRHTLQFIETSLRLFLSDSSARTAEEIRSIIPDQDAPDVFHLQSSWHLFTYYSLASGIDVLLEATPLPNVTEAFRFNSGAVLRLALRTHSGLPPIESDHPLSRIEGSLRGVEALPEEIIADIDAVLAEEPTQLHNFSALLGLIEWLDRPEGSRFVTSDLPGRISGSLDRWLEWLASTPAPAVIERTLREFGHHLSPAQRSHHEASLEVARKRGREVLAEMDREGSQVGTDVNRIRLQTIGGMGIRPEGSDETIPVRGVGICRALATMAVDLTLDESMRFEEIIRLVSGDDAVDPERGRKLVNNTVYKIRKMMPPDSIIADRGMVRLNTDVVDVDLLELDRSLREAEKGLLKGMVARTLHSLTHALELYGGGTLFEELFDPFFDAARSQVEWRVRTALLDTAAMLHDEGDIQGCETLLRQGVTSMPGDEEVAEELCRVLRAQGKFVEGMRVENLS